MYVNGEKVASKAIDNSIEHSPNPLLIGTTNHRSDQGFTGSIDDVRIYNRALSSSEIQNLYNGIEEEEDTECSLPSDSSSPTGSVHAYPNMIWPPNNKMTVVSLEGYVTDELSTAVDGGGIGVSSVYLLVDGERIILRDGETDLLNSDGSFSVTTEVIAKKGMTYDVELYAEDSNSNNGFVDSTYINVPNDMSDGKSKKLQ